MLHAKFKIIYSRFLGRNLVKVFIIPDGGHLGHVTLTIYKYKLSFLLSRDSLYEI